MIRYVLLFECGSCGYIEQRKLVKNYNVVKCTYCCNGLSYVKDNPPLRSSR